MTNGEKILSTFPNAIARTVQNEGFTYIEVETDEWITGFDDTWWNAEYKEPTTNNDLAVDCIVDVLGSYTDLDIPYKCEIAENILTKLPSVTPQLSSELEKNSQKLEKDFGELDCISREQALRELKESAEHHANDSREETLLRRDRDIIRALPTVTPIRPKGQWMGDSYGYICSNCEHSLNDLAQSMDYISFSKPKYCPNCGADMREVENE